MGRTPRTGTPDVDTRQRLLDAGRELFTGAGFEATSTRDIAARAGCNVSLIKYYFGSKEGLLREIVRSFAEVVGERIRGIRETPATPAERIEAFVGTMLTQLSAQPDLYRMVFREVCSATSPIGAELREVVLQNQRMAVAMLAEGQASGDLRELPTPVVGMMIAGMLMFYFIGYPFTSRIVGEVSPETIETLRRTAVEILLRGVLSEGARGEETR